MPSTAKAKTTLAEENLLEVQKRLKQLRVPLTGVVGFLDMFRKGSLKATKKDFQMLENQIMKVIEGINEANEFISLTTTKGR